MPETLDPPSVADAMTALAEKYRRVMSHPTLMTEGGQTPDAVIEQLMRMEILKRDITDLAKVVGQAYEAFGLEQCRVHGPALFPYYPGVETSYKCLDVAKALRAVELAAGGDEEAVNACLSSSALKPAACRNVLKGDFAVHFETRKDAALKESTGKRADAVRLQKASDFGLR